MGIAAYIVLYIIAAPFVLLTLPGYWKLFQKAGHPGWKALIPIYSDYIMLKISGRPTWWVVWLFIPTINILVFAGIFIDFIKSFGKFKTREQAAGFFLPFIFLPKWGFDDKTEYLGQSASTEFKEQYKGRRKSDLKDWTLAILFPVVAAMFIRTFFFEAYVIPTPAMERSILVGDCLFVSKMSYGARLPITPLAFPFAHHTIPGIGIKAYSESVKLPYYRLPGFGNIKRGDVVVFNYPHDTINNRPVDKRENFIKRCEGISGDTLSLVSGQVYVNGKPMPNPPGEQMEYAIKTKGDINPQLFNDLHITVYEGHVLPAMTRASANILRGSSNVESVTTDVAASGSLSSNGPVFPECFPMHVQLTAKLPDYKWTPDNFGPIIIPKKGWTVKLDSLTFPLYERAIEVYENNNVLVVNNSIILINGKKTDSYTFKMDYYWVMGDNRHDSEDSRYWGFVPEDHIVGKAWFIWMSSDDSAPLFSSIRWDRLFRRID